MKVVLFRHATRSSQDLGDSPLSTVGLAQAQEIPRHLSPQGPLPPPTHLFCSPKKRARQTLQPLAQFLNIAPIIDPRLDERHQNESGKDFEIRTRAILEEAAQLQGNSCAYLCSHLDWLELALALIPSDMSDLEMASSWSTAEFKVFKIVDGLWTFNGAGHISCPR